MKIYLVIDKIWWFTDEYLTYLDPGWLDQENPGQIFLDQTEAFRVARERNHARLRGDHLSMNDLSYAQGPGLWGSTEGSDWAGLNVDEGPPWYENPQFDPLHPVLERWNTSLKEFDWQIPVNAAAEDLDVLIKVFDLERCMVREAEITNEDLVPEIQQYLEQYQGEVGAFSTLEDRKAVKIINDWFFREALSSPDGWRNSYYSEDWVEGSDSNQDGSAKD